MALPARARAGYRRSFLDARNDGRKMEATWHEEAGVLVLSLWQGDRCRSTFQLPIEEAPALVSVLTSALGDAIASPAPERTTLRTTAAASPRPASPLLRYLRRALSTRAAPVVPLRSVGQRSGPTAPSR